MLRGHGGEIYHLAREFGLSPKEIADHSSNVSPLPPPGGLYELLRDHLPEIEYLPEVDSFSLREALGLHFGLPPEAFFPSSGTTEWIFALPKLHPFKRAIILGPTYGDYADALRRNGIPFEYFLAHEEDDFRWDLFALRRNLSGVDLVFLCNPNNPTGVYILPDELLALIEDHQETIFVVDESYIDFVNQGLSLLRRSLPDNLLVLYSFSKIYRIPGLRLGFAAAGRLLRPLLSKHELPWAVNRLAQVAGPWLLEQATYRKRVKDFVLKERQRLLPSFSAHAMKLFPGEVHFFLLKFPFPVHPLWETLLKRFRILVREATNFHGLGPHYLRLALRDEEANDRLLKALGEVLSEGSYRLSITNSC